MKKIIFALSLIITTLCSCQEDDTIHNNMIIGEWELSYAEVCDNDGNIIFEGVESPGEVMTHLSFSCGTLVTTINYDEEDIENYIYRIEDNTLYLMDNGWSFKLNIEKLSKKELVITYPKSRYIYDDDSESYVDFEFIFRLYYKKQ